jgi:hypothetical protein
MNEDEVRGWGDFDAGKDDGDNRLFVLHSVMAEVSDIIAKLLPAIVFEDKILDVPTIVKRITSDLTFRDFADAKFKASPRDDKQNMEMKIASIVRECVVWNLDTLKNSDGSFVFSRFKVNKETGAETKETRRKAQSSGASLFGKLN